MVSLITAPLDLLAARVSAVADLMQTDRDLLGSHLEGPFLDVGHKGAHDPELLRAPVADDVRRLLDAGRGTVRQVTLAPELDGGLDAIRIVVAAGAAAAVGHTDADDDTLRAAFDAGATILTHAFNAMRPVHHREPGPVLTAAHDERVTLEAIADNIHLHPHVIKLALRRGAGARRAGHRRDGGRRIRRRRLPARIPARDGHGRRRPGRQRIHRRIDPHAGCGAAQHRRGGRPARRTRSRR